MNKKFLCYIDSMALAQRVICPDGTEAAVSSTNFAEGIIALCDQYSNYSVHLFGNQSYLEGVTDSIQRTEIQTYSKNKIEIEVN